MAAYLHSVFALANSAKHVAHSNFIEGKGSRREIPSTNFNAFAVNFHCKLLLLDYNSFLKLPERKNLDDFETQTFSAFSILMLVIG